MCRAAAGARPSRTGTAPRSPRSASASRPGMFIGIYQSYYVFNTTAISTVWDVLRMGLNRTEVQGSWNACTGEPTEPVYLHSMGLNAGIGSSTDGSNVSVLGTSTMKDMVAPADNPNTADNCANQPADFDVTSLAGFIKGKANWTFGVSGDNTDNTSAGQFMRMSDNPTLVTTFDEFPAAPSMQQSAPTEQDSPATADTKFGCVSSSNSSPEIPWIGAAASVQLNANFTAPLSGEEVEPGWKVWNAASTLVNQTNANTTAGVFPFSFTSPADGDEYYSQIWTTVNGNGGQGGFDPGETTQGPECSFAVDATPPTVPAVTSTAFPPSGSSPGTTQLAPGASGPFAFTASDPSTSGCASSNPIADAGFASTADTTCLASGAYEFEYSLNQATPQRRRYPGHHDLPERRRDLGSGRRRQPDRQPDHQHERESERHDHRDLMPDHREPVGHEHPVRRDGRRRGQHRPRPTSTTSTCRGTRRPQSRQATSTATGSPT